MDFDVGAKILNYPPKWGESEVKSANIGTSSLDAVVKSPVYGAKRGSIEKKSRAIFIQREEKL